MESEKGKTNYTKCLRCGRKLKNSEYQIRGYGKVCWEKIKHTETEKDALFTIPN